MLKGISQQLHEDGLMKQGCFGIQVADDDAKMLQDLYSPERGYSGKYKDDLTGQPLRDDLVKAARKVELDFSHSKGVWRKAPRSKAKTGLRTSTHKCTVG